LYKAKLASRLGMIYLKPRATLWAYKKEVKKLNSQMARSSESKLQTNSGQLNLGSGTKQQVLEQDESFNYFQDIPLSSLEDIIEFLLVSLCDKDTVVRWSAAKGLGRITGRLDLDMADDVVDAVFQLMTQTDGDTWHGCQLTIAELSRRGLLLPARLDQAMNALKKALLFDENKGNFTAGANVRDAACYVAWAFDRAYDAQIMQHHVLDLAKHLLIVSLYDREINCRRAASAAFQEHVGRQGCFPHGNEILTEADYFTVGLALNAYLNVGLYVSNFAVYYEPFIHHLSGNKLRHLDIKH